MRDRPDPLDSDHQFFSALVEGDLDALHQLLTDDFTLIEVMSGSQIGKAAFIEAMESGHLQFTAIESLDAAARIYHGCAIVTGRTHLGGRLGDTAFEAHSRYTHVF